MKRRYFLLLIILLTGFLIRFLSVWPANTVIGFDQARDLFDSLKIIHGDIRIIGPTAGNNPNLHHGVAWLYFMIPPLLFSGNPVYVALWNSLFNAGAAIILFFLAKSLFKNLPNQAGERTGYIAAILASVSYYYVEFSGWLSNPTASFITLPLFFLGIVKYHGGKKWGLPLATFFLGLSIEFELFFLYLIPVGIILWLILKPKLPSIKLAISSVLAFLFATSTMVATEIKFHFAGVKSILVAGQLVGAGKNDFAQDFIIFLQEKWETFYLNFWPQNKEAGTIIGILAVSFLIFEIFYNLKKKDIVKRNLFLLVWFFSPSLMFFLGVHNAPWFYIGRPASAILIGSYLISKIKSKTVVASILVLIAFANLAAVKDTYGKGQPLLEPDTSSVLSSQIAVMDYTYQKAGWAGLPAGRQAFAINTVTNPLYINAVWAWDYDWYSQKYGCKPSWLGGDQLPPYNTLPAASGKEQYFFLIIDETPRIPEVHKILARQWAEKRGRLIEEKDFPGWQVSMWQIQKLK